MPIYEYVCQACGKKTEIIQRMGERPLKICPHCGGKLRKAASAPAIRFKGTGWYVTDYARARKEEKAASSEGAPSESKAAESKKEKVGETKSESGEKPKKKS
jgi:putative FmdB family regulatory protein